MDSIKQRYTGTWELEGNQVIMTYKPKKITEFSPNLDPNASGQGYVTHDIVVELGTRTGTINGDKLEFGHPSLTAIHYSDAVAGIKNFWEIFS